MNNFKLIMESWRGFKTLLNERTLPASQYPRTFEELQSAFKEFEGKTLIFFDTETTGLNRNPVDKPINQLTQIGAIATQINGETLRFYELDRINLKIRLNDDLKGQIANEPDVL